MTTAMDNAVESVRALAKMAREEGVRRLRVGDVEIELELATPREGNPPDIDLGNSKPTGTELIVRKLSRIGSRGDVNADGDDE